MGLKVKLWINIKKDSEIYYDQTHEGEQAIQIGLMFTQQKIHLNEKIRSEHEKTGLLAFAFVHLAVDHEEGSAVTVFSGGDYVHNLDEVIDFESDIQNQFQSIFPDGVPQDLEDYAKTVYFDGKSKLLKQEICKVLDDVPLEYTEEILTRCVDEDSLKYIKETVGTYRVDGSK